MACKRIVLLYTPHELHALYIEQNSSHIGARKGDNVQKLRKGKNNIIAAVDNTWLRVLVLYTSSVV